MPRSTRTAGSTALWALPDEAERLMRAAARHDALAAAAAAAAEEAPAPALHVQGEGGDVGGLDGAHPGADDPFAFPADEGGNGDDAGNDAGDDAGSGDGSQDALQLLAVEVDGGLAGEEDARELAAAEQVVHEQEAAGDRALAEAAAAAGGADTEPEEDAPFVRPVVRPFLGYQGGKGKGAKRHRRKVLRDNIRTHARPRARTRAPSSTRPLPPSLAASSCSQRGSPRLRSASSLAVEA